MPTHLPNDHFQKSSRAKVAVARDTKEEKPARTPRAERAVVTTDWLALWSLSIALSALVMAGIVYFNESDTVGTSVILAGAAGIVASVLLFSEAPHQND